MEFVRLSGGGVRPDHLFGRPRRSRIAGSCTAGSRARFGLFLSIARLAVRASGLFFGARLVEPHPASPCAPSSPTPRHADVPVSVPRGGTVSCCVPSRGTKPFRSTPRPSCIFPLHWSCGTVSFRSISSAERSRSASPPLRIGSVPLWSMPAVRFASYLSLIHI